MFLHNKTERKRETQRERERESQKLSLRVEMKLFSISSAATPTNNSYLIY